MKVERMTLEQMAEVHGALADVTRLRILDLLAVSDAASSELASALGIPTNLLAHHVNVLERAGLVGRRRSEGDARRAYLRLVPGALGACALGSGRTVARAVSAPTRVVFVCTANSARSHLAAALWATVSAIPATSAGTHPADQVARGAVAAAARHGFPLPEDAAPRAWENVAASGDLNVTVCDLAHEELARPHGWLHWSIPDPAPAGTRAAFDATVSSLRERIQTLAPRLDQAQAAS